MWKPFNWSLQPSFQPSHGGFTNCRKRHYDESEYNHGQTTFIEAVTLNVDVDVDRSG